MGFWAARGPVFHVFLGRYTDGRSKRRPDKRKGDGKVKRSVCAAVDKLGCD